MNQHKNPKTIDVLKTDCNKVIFDSLYFNTLEFITFIHAHTHRHMSICSKWGRELSMVGQALAKHVLVVKVTSFSPKPWQACMSYVCWSLCLLDIDTMTLGPIRRFHQQPIDLGRERGISPADPAQGNPPELQLLAKHRASPPQSLPAHLHHNGNNLLLNAWIVLHWQGGEGRPC